MTDTTYPLVEIENGCYCWTLWGGNDPLGFWDRFLDGMTEQKWDRLSNRQLMKMQAKEWMHQRRRDLRDGII